ncbi:MAG: PQQ-binding-like beta-propeller repeat protein [Pseudomonadota bacterium]
MLRSFTKFNVIALAVLVQSQATGIALAEPVTDARLHAAGQETANWLINGREYNNQRFSPLTQIDRKNVKKLRLKWKFQTGVPGTFQATPLVENNVMYISTAFSHVIAVDARTGSEIWRYRHSLSAKKLFGGPSNRGVALGYGKVYVATVDARLVALDAATGRKVWEIPLVTRESDTESKAALSTNNPVLKDNVRGSTGVGAAAAPLVYNGKVIVGITGVGYGLHLEKVAGSGLESAVVGIAGKYGQPGFLAAFDAETGAQVWKFETTKDGWEGQFTETTAYGQNLGRDVEAEKNAAPRFRQAWKFGGGSIFHTPALDKSRGILFFGTGNPSPQGVGVGRPGDNLYTSSLIALDAKTGKLVWYFQQVPHDLWGYDVASPPTLFDVEINGKALAAVGQASKMGWYFVHERETGKFLFKSKAFVPQKNLFSPPSKDGITIYPGPGGGANWSPTAYDPELQFVYVSAVHMPFEYTKNETQATDKSEPTAYTTLKPLKKQRHGTLSAIDLANKGRIAWQFKSNEPMIGGTLATQGRLVFSGEGNGQFSAFDSVTGERLWTYDCGAGANAPPISFEVDGQQYIAIAAGGNALWGFKSGDSVLVFSLAE